MLTQILRLSSRDRVWGVMTIDGRSEKPTFQQFETTGAKPLFETGLGLFARLTSSGHRPLTFLSFCFSLYY